MHVLLAGAGYVAAQAGLALVADGVRVVALRRNPAALPPELSPVAADLTDAESLAVLPAGIDHVLYAASPDQGDAAAYETAYVLGLSTLLGFLAERGDPVRRVVLLTSTGVYGQMDGAWVDETSETAPASPSGQALVAAEQRLWSLTEGRGVSLRLGGIYGPGRTSFIDRVRDGRARMPTAAKYGNRIHRDDAARASIHLLRLGSPERAYNGVDEDPADFRDVYRYLADTLGVPVPPPAEEGVDTTLRTGRSHKRVSSERLRASGFVFRYPSYREGYAALISATEGR